MKDLILNPVENFPLFGKFSDTFNSEIAGLYITDKNRDENSKKNAKILFAGRETLTDKVSEIYQKWATLLNASALSMRLFSGLHAHIITFMSIGNIGDCVLLLPTEGGGHYATKTILRRLGYNVIDMAIDYENFAVDQEKTYYIIKERKPNFIFVDRSEGINYEDFSEICSKEICCIYDASQYLSNIITRDFKSPFDMGFNLLISTMHKNFPGPQKALICTNDEENIYWKKTIKGLYTYVSNIHAENIFRADESINNLDFIKRYAQMSLKNSISLENELYKRNVSVVRKKSDLPPTHHIWITFESQKNAYLAFRELEKFHLFTNYRFLPYNLGYGLRLGTTAATLQGLTTDDTAQLANYIARILSASNIPSIEQVQEFIISLETKKHLL